MSYPITRLLNALHRPSRKLEIAAWLFLIAAIVAVRVYLWHLVPFYLWSKDAGSYSAAAWQWLHAGGWETDPRRGAMYSLFIAVLLKLFGSFDAVVIAQHGLGGLAVFGGLLVFRRMIGPHGLLPLLGCGWAYAVYAGPLAMEHLIRNETLLFVFATATLAGWWLALHGAARWLWLSGIAASLLALTKSVFVPFPVIVVAALLWLHRKQLSHAWKRVAIFLCALALPIIGDKIFHQLTAHEKPPEPQSGLLLFARVAQFTVLESGIEPGIKALIRPDIESYRTMVAADDDLDNNIPLNRTAVPHMREYLLSRGQTPSDLNRLCRRLAIEAIRAHPREYFTQVWSDFARLHLTFGTLMHDPAPADLLGTKKALTSAPDEPSLRRAEVVAAIDARVKGDKKSDKVPFRFYRGWVDTAWLFQFMPVLLTSLLLPVFIWRTRDANRWWWITCAGLFYFNAVLLSTVGKPMDRYLIPVEPIMFWTLGNAVAAAWLALLSRPPQADPLSS